MSDEVDEELPPFRLSRTVIPVALGGAVGTLLRALILDTNVNSGTWHAALSFYGVPTLASTALERFPWALILINTVGVFVATWLLSGPLRHRSPDDGVRLFAVTGLLGGLTSYSSLVVDLAWMKQVSLAGAVVTLAVAVAAGLGAARIGLRTGRS